MTVIIKSTPASSGRWVQKVLLNIVTYSSPGIATHLDKLINRIFVGIHYDSNNNIVLSKFQEGAVNSSIARHSSDSLEKPLKIIVV